MPRIISYCEAPESNLCTHRVEVSATSGDLSATAAGLSKQKAKQSAAKALIDKIVDDDSGTLADLK